jgi:hypothetical protein
MRNDVNVVIFWGKRNRNDVIVTLFGGRKKRKFSRHEIWRIFAKIYSLSLKLAFRANEKLGFSFNPIVGGPPWIVPPSHIAIRL